MRRKRPGTITQGRFLYSSCRIRLTPAASGGSRRCSKVWVPLVTIWTDSTIKGTAYCGWETSTGTKWGAIWRYDRGDSYTDFSPTNKTFWAPLSSEVSTVTNRYQFSISAGSASLSLISSTDIAGGTPSNGKIPFDIPGVDENPIILEFSNEQ